MNKKKFLALLVSSAFLFAACGEDDRPLSPEYENEISSSSMEDCDDDECDEGKSSSSKKVDSKSSSSKANDNKSSDSKGDGKSSAKDDSKSSSSAKSESKSSSSAEAPKSSSSFDGPEGARAAKLADLEKNMELKLFDQTVYLSTGSKQGLVALRIPDELWVVTYTDFENGKIQFVDGNVGKQFAETDATKKILDELKPACKEKNEKGSCIIAPTDGIVLSFIVEKDGKVMYSVNDSKDYSEAVKASVSVLKDKISKAEDLKDKIYECTDGDTTRTFTFFDNSYIVENSVGKKLAYWVGGRYDIQRSTLLMRPTYYNISVYTMYSYSVGTDKTIVASDGKSMSCKVESSSDEYQKADDFVGEWTAAVDGINWEFKINAAGTYELTAFENNKNVEVKKGAWEIYGSQLMMRNQGCLHPEKCTTSIHGKLQKGTYNKETGKLDGFSFIHSDTDTPKIPTSFEAPEYE